jgi:hypothetical protein
VRIRETEGFRGRTSQLFVDEGWTIRNWGSVLQLLELVHLVVQAGEDDLVMPASAWHKGSRDLRER